MDACTKAEAIVIATEWKEFRQIDWKTVYAQMNKPAFVFDGRLLVDADELRQIGFTVRLAFSFIKCLAAYFLSRCPLSAAVTGCKLYCLIKSVRPRMDGIVDSYTICCLCGK
jgi:hypothetical protein